MQDVVVCSNTIYDHYLPQHGKFRTATRLFPSLNTKQINHSKLRHLVESNVSIRLT